jgi:hypothetical protein
MYTRRLWCWGVCMYVGFCADGACRLREPVEDEEFRLKIGAADFAAAGTRAIEDLRRAAAATPGWSLVPNNYGTRRHTHTCTDPINVMTRRCAAEGVRIACDAEHGDGWCLLRLSLHDPVLPLNIQSDRAGGVAAIARQLLAALATTPDLDMSPLTAYVAAQPL